MEAKLLYKSKPTMLLSTIIGLSIFLSLNIIKINPQNIGLITISAGIIYFFVLAFDRKIFEFYTDKIIIKYPAKFWNSKRIYSKDDIECIEYRFLKGPYQMCNFIVHPKSKNINRLRFRGDSIHLHSELIRREYLKLLNEMKSFGWHIIINIEK